MTKQLPPSPPGNFLLGHFSEYSRNPLEFLRRCAREFGDVVLLRLPATRLILLNHPGDIERVLAETNRGFINHGGMRLSLTRS
jgi:cytochrome P450